MNTHGSGEEDRKGDRREREERERQRGSMWDVKWVSVDMSRWIDPGCTLDELSSTKSLAYAEINMRLFAGRVRLLSSLSICARRSESIQIDLYIPHIVHIFFLFLHPLFLRGSFADGYGEYISRRAWLIKPSGIWCSSRDYSPTLLYTSCSYSGKLFYMW